MNIYFLNKNIFLSLCAVVLCFLFATETVLAQTQAEQIKQNEQSKQSEQFGQSESIEGTEVFPPILNIEDQALLPKIIGNYLCIRDKHPSFYQSVQSQLPREANTTKPKHYHIFVTMPDLFS